MLILKSFKYNISYCAFKKNENTNESYNRLNIASKNRLYSIKWIKKKKQKKNS